MLIAGIILACLAILGFVVTAYIAQQEDVPGISFSAWLCGGLCTLGLYMIVDADKTKTPTAMDVYNGKTTLEYTIVDGVVKDSTVIWKQAGNILKEVVEE